MFIIPLFQFQWNYIIELDKILTFAFFGPNHAALIIIIIMRSEMFIMHFLGRITQP